MPAILAYFMGTRIWNKQTEIFIEEKYSSQNQTTSLL